MAIGVVASQQAYVGQAIGSTRVTAYPFTIFARARTSQNTANQVIATFRQSGGAVAGWDLFFAGANAGDPTLFFREVSNSSAASAGYSTNTWYAMTGVETDSTTYTLWQDGASTAGTGTQAFFAGSDTFQMGTRFNGSFTQFLDGQLACGALWDVALTTAEITSLVAGFSPRRIRPQSLKFYVPLAGNYAMWVGTSNSPMGASNTTIVSHPRSYGF